MQAKIVFAVTDGDLAVFSTICMFAAVISDLVVFSDDTDGSAKLAEPLRGSTTCRLSAHACMHRASSQCELPWQSLACSCISVIVSVACVHVACRGNDALVMLYGITF